MSSDLARPTTRVPTLQDVASVAGVSPATVSRVINNIRNVDPALHAVVMNAVQQTGYVANRTARSLVTRRAGLMALIVSEAEKRDADDPFMSRFFSDPFFGRVVGGMLGALSPSAVHLSLLLAGSDHTRAGIVSSLRQGQVDGVAVISLHPGDHFPQMLADAGVPAVLYGRPATAMPISFVDVDNALGARLAADRLVARGCRRVATIAGSLDMPAGADRLDAFRTAMAGHGHLDVPYAEGGFTHAGGAAAMLALLAAHPEIDGVFAASDVMAQGALPVLREHGREVPTDVAVVGFDDSSAALACWPPLTTIRQPIEDMAADMGRMLLGAHTDSAVTSKLFEPTLVIRGSA